MTVKELIEKLQKCSPDAIVCVEANCDCLAKEVKEYVITETDERHVYIADNLDYIDEVILGVGEDEYVSSAENGDYSPSNPWDAPGMKMSDFIQGGVK